MKALLRTLPPSAVLLTLLCIVSATSLASVMRGPGLLLSAVVGSGLVLATTVLSRRYELLTAEWLAVSLIGFFLIGGLVTGPIPTPAAYTDFFRGLTGGWADLLSSVPPVEAAGQWLALPYTLAWLAGMLGFGIMRHLEVPIAPAIGPALAFGIGLLFSVELQLVALLQGSLIVALTLALGWYQQRRLGFEVDEEIGNTTVARRRSRLLYGGAALACAAVAAPMLAPLAPGLDGRERFDLRDQLEPPWNPLDEPSPLAQIKGNYLEGVRDDVVFVARGDAIPRRWNLATLASFDGTVWTVGDSEFGNLAPFRPIDLATPVVESPPPVRREPTTVAVEVVDLEGPWLPTPGRPEEVAITGEWPEGSIRFNDRTATAAFPLWGGDGADGAFDYTVTARPNAILGDDELQNLTFVSGGELGLDQQAPSVRNWSADVVEGADAGWQQIDAIRAELQTGGYSTEERVEPGHSWARLSVFFDTENFYGFEEQYAAIAGIAARNAGLRSRVVVGYLIDSSKLEGSPSEVPVTKTEATAWLEVLTLERGWVPIDVTPDRDNEPSFEDAGVRTEAVAAPNPPPTIPPPPEQEIAPDDEVEDDGEDEEEDDEAVGRGVPTVVLAAAVAIGAPLLLLGGWIGLLAGVRVLRRRRRRAAAEADRRVAGAWFEARDRLDEFGITSTSNASLHEFAVSAEQQSNALVGVKELADITDRCAFGAGTTPDEVADEAWDRSDALVSRVRRSRTPFERFRVLASPRSLFRKDPA